MSGDRRQRLLLAGRARASLEHPHLLRARVATDGRGRVRILLQRYEAPTLSEVLSTGPLSLRDALKLLYAVASAVEALNRAGLVARELQPERILVCPRRGALLADTGIPPELWPRPLAEASAESTCCSPEERSGLAIDARSNVYSLGALLLAMLTTPDGRRRELPSGARAALERAMAVDPAERRVAPRELVVAVAAGFGVSPRSGAHAEPLRQAKPKPRARQPNGQAARPSRKPASPPRVRTRPTLPRLRTPVLPRVTLSAPRRPTLPAFSPAGRRAATFVAAVVGCIVAGILLGRALPGDEQPSRAASSAVALELPPGWEETAVAGDGGFELSAPLAAAPAGDRGTGVVAGLVTDVVALDRRFRAAAERTEVGLGQLDAWRYAGLRPRRGLAATAYLAPTSGRSLLVVCHARRRDAGARLPECEEIASTIALRRLRPANLSEWSRREEQVGSAMTKLRLERERGRTRLAEAEFAAQQARTARQLARVHRKAAVDLGALQASRAAPALDELVTSLRATAGAYTRLAHAAAGPDRAAYRAASEDVREGEAATEQAAARTAAS